MAEILVIGYGNSLRSDDAAGPRVAAAVGDWPLPGVRAIATHQLTPELIDPLSAAHLVIFVDARHAHAGDPVRVQPIDPHPIGSAFQHACDPHWLLACVQAVFGSRPRAWLITVPATDFAVGEGLSPTARDGLVAALRAIAALLASVPSSVGGVGFRSLIACYRDPAGCPTFEIRHSETEGPRTAVALPDLATRPDARRAGGRPGRDHRGRRRAGEGR